MVVNGPVVLGKGPSVSVWFIKVKSRLISVGFFVSNEYIVFTIGGTIALRLSVPTFYDRRATDLQLEKGLTLLLYKFEFLSRNDVWFEIGQMVL